MSSMNPPEAACSISITTRLVLLYLVSTLLILFCTNWFQFRTLTEDLEFEDNDLVIEHITRIRSIIARHPDTFIALKDHIGLDDASHPTRYLVRVQDAAGHTIIESPGMHTVPSVLFPPPVLSGRPIGHGTKYLAETGTHYLLNSGWAEGFGDPHFRLVQVAVDDSDEVALMAKYRWKIAISVLVGLCLAAGLGIIITRKGLQPLQKMATSVAQITETDLHQRIRTRTWPKELDQLTLALDGMLARLEDSFSRLSEFSANMAHELRTPINNLRGEAEVALSRARSSEEYRRIIESSIEEYERLARMVGDILFLARPDQSFAPLEIDARAEIERLAEYYRNIAEEQQIGISVQGTGTVSADPNLFQRALGNIISNALHYTPAGGHIEVTIAAADGGGLVIAIKDTGMGIPAAEVPLIFDRFYRTAQARQLYNQGSGLGLAIVRSIMALHGGTVTMTSDQGKGATVLLRFCSSGRSSYSMTEM